MGKLAKLSDLQLRQAKPGQKPVKLTDGGGLYLLLTPAGGRYWRYNYQMDGKERTLAIGVYPDIPLAKAREIHQAARSQVALGVDPMASRRAVRQLRASDKGESFEAVAREFWDRQLKKGRSRSYVEEVVGKLEKDLFPWLGRKSINEITEPDLLACLVRVEARAEETARRLRGFAGQVFRYAIQTGRASRDPSVALRGALATPRAGHFAAITTPREFADLIRALRQYRGEFVTRCLLNLSPYVFQRPSELREARWCEFDLDGDRFEWGVPMWEIPSERIGAEGDTKITRTGWHSHLVPLSRQAVSILEQLKPLTYRSGLVFASSRKQGRPLSDGTVLGAIRRMGFAGQMTAHGFCASARTLAAERLKVDRDLLELQISHRVADSLGRAYNRTQFLDERIDLMQRWADYVDELTASQVEPSRRIA
ncbi:MAG: tyrosine-type recombinase/integrase [Pigmentiphaga sp.]